MTTRKIRNFAVYPEAELAKNLLGKNRIRSWIQMGNLNAGRGGYGGEADLFVNEKDAERAEEILGNGVNMIAE